MLLANIMLMDEDVLARSHPADISYFSIHDPNGELGQRVELLMDDTTFLAQSHLTDGHESAADDRHDTEHLRKDCARPDITHIELEVCSPRAAPKPDLSTVTDDACRCNAIEVELLTAAGACLRPQARMESAPQHGQSPHPQAR